MVKKYIPLLLTLALATTMASACNTFPTETPAPSETPIVTETVSPTPVEPTVDPTSTPYVPPTPVTPGWQNAGWYPIAPPESFFDAANALGDNYSHDGYDEWASRDVYTFGIKDAGANAQVCSVSAKNTSGLEVQAQTYDQPGGDSLFASMCATIPLTHVGTLPEGQVYSFAGGPQNGVGYILVPDSEASSGNVYVATLAEDTGGTRVGMFTGEQLTDEILLEGFARGCTLERAASFPGVWGTPVPPAPQGSVPGQYDTLALASLPTSREKYALNLSE